MSEDILIQQTNDNRPESHINTGFGLFVILLLLAEGFIFFDVPFLRQWGVFCFFTMAPGLLLLIILKLNTLSFIKRVFLSVGISVSFLMLFGIFINFVYHSLGYPSPLSTISLALSFGGATLILGVIARLRNPGGFAVSVPRFSLGTSGKAALVVPAFLPLMSIWGLYLIDTTGNNVVLMAFMVIIPLYVIGVTIFRKSIPSRVYPLALFLIGLSVLLLYALRSEHLIGIDIHKEFYLFQLVSNSGYWQIFPETELAIKGTFNACLSVTLLPVIYNSLTNMGGEYVFRIIPIAIFSAIPLIIYTIAKSYMGSFPAFLASFLFISQIAFIQGEPNSRTIIAILYFALTVFVILDRDMVKRNKTFLFIIFTVSMIISHYTTTYIFVFLICFTWLGELILRLSRRSNLGNQYPPYFGSSNFLALVFALLFLFFWYGIVAPAPLQEGIIFFMRSLSNIKSILLSVGQSDSGVAVLGVGLRGREFPLWMHVIVSWFFTVFIGIGVLWVLWSLIRRKESEEFVNFQSTQLLMALGCLVTLVISVLLPYAMQRYDMTRVYFMTMVLLVVFFIIGGRAIEKWLRCKNYVLILIVGLTFYLCNTGTLYQFFNIPRSIFLNTGGSDYNDMYIYEQEIQAGKWLAMYRDADLPICTDHLGDCRLISQANLGDANAYTLFNYRSQISGYLYLRNFNTSTKKFLNRERKAEEITLHNHQLAGHSVIYANGRSEVLIIPEIPSEEWSKIIEKIRQ